MLKYAPAILVLLILAVCGVLQGSWSGRWTAGATNKEVAERVKRLPLAFADWDGREFEEDSRAIATPDEHYLQRGYLNVTSATRMSVLVGWGLPEQLLFNHTPLGCYPGKGYVVQGAPKNYL